MEDNNQVDTKRYDKFIIALQLLIVVVVAIGILLALFAPSVFMVFINLFWLLLFGVVASFLLLGILIMIGLKEEVKKIIGVFVEGTLSIVDLINFFKKVIVFIIDSLKLLVFYLAPIIAYGIALAIYYGVIYFYKWVGKSYDVTYLTVGLTVILVLFTGLLNKRGKETGEPETWFTMIRKRFKHAFTDGIEISLFVFFLTMDSTQLFFLPKELNVPLRAEFLGIDLMPRGWEVGNNIRITFNIVIAAIVLEIVRFLIKIVAGGYEFYRNIKLYLGDQYKKVKTVGQIKWVLRQSFQANMDDIIKFITYTTFLIAVFLAFPRLKLVAMAVTSITSLVLDLLIKERLAIRRGNDLFSRIVSFLFKV